LNINPLISKIAGLFPCGKNSKYKSPDFACRLIDSAIENQSLEAKYKLERTFSADIILNKLHKISKEQTENLMNNSNKKQILVIRGARQCGKTTLLKQIKNKYEKKRCSSGKYP